MAAGWWAETFASITARAQAAQAGLGGEQPGSGSIAATVQRVTAALVGNQPFTGQVAATAKPAQAVLVGGMAPEGALAVQLRSALFSSVGGSAFEGAISGQAQPALAALIGDQTQQGSIAALLQKASAALVGQQPYAGALAGTAQRATAALVGDQPFTATLAGQARPAVAALAGGQTQQGALAATARTATASMSGAADSTPVTVIGTPNIAATSTVTIPAHQVGDLIIIIGFRLSNSAISQPAAGGTVPTWNQIDLLNGTRTAYAVATATNHTSGGWIGANHLIAVVLRNQAASPIGGHDIAQSTGLNSIAPSVTMVNTGGSSVLLHAHQTDQLSGSSWAAAPAGYTRLAALAATSGNSVCLNSKDVTTSDGSVSQGTALSAGTGYRAVTIEILK